MASIGKDPNGCVRILFVAGDGTRKTVRLGKVSAKQATAFKVKLEALVAQVITGSTDDETSRWVAALPETTHARLAAVGLVKPRAIGRLGLTGLVDAFVASRPRMKEHTRLNWVQVRQWLVRGIGEHRDVRSIDAATAEDWRTFMEREGLGDNTARRHIGRARQLFKWAIKRGMVRGVNPFEGISASVRADKKRLFFVTREMTAKVIDACPDAQWRLMIALSRFGGLRCPSEHLALTWSDVDWAKNRIRVPSPKTEHHEGKESREIPIFPELRPHLMQVFEEAEAGTVHVITRYREKYGNLRTQLGRIIRRAGLSVWPKPWHNMRSTRQTELAETYPMHIVCAWIGNSRAVAQEHYLQVTDAHFTQASGGDPAGAAQNPAQYAAVNSGNAPQRTPAEKQNRPDLPSDSAECRYLPIDQVPAVGFEPTTCALGKRRSIHLS